MQTCLKLTLMCPDISAFVTLCIHIYKLYNKNMKQKSELPASQDMDLKIQWAHRTLAPISLSDAPPRPIVVNFLEFITKELILSETWKKRKIQVGGRIIYFDYDYVSEIVKNLQEYNTIKKALKQKGIHFQTQYTSMQIHWATGVCTYSTA